MHEGMNLQCYSERLAHRGVDEAPAAVTAVHRPTLAHDVQYSFRVKRANRRKHGVIDTRF